MLWAERALVLLFLFAGMGAFVRVLWKDRLCHVWPKRNEAEIVNPAGLFTGIVEVLTHRIVIKNRPLVGLFHLPLFYGFAAFGAKSALHFLDGLGIHIEAPLWYTQSLDIIAVVVLASLVFMAVRRYIVQRGMFTHPVESGFILSLIGLLMVTQLLESVTLAGGWAFKANWWVHYLSLVAFPAVIAHGKHLHLLMGPVNVVLKHMTQLPSDRQVFGNDFDVETEEEAKMEAEYARLGMPNGVADFSFSSLLDRAACIECGRCNDACPAGPNLQPRDHFVQSLKDPSIDAEALAKTIPAEVAATCVQCRACDWVCPTGCRPSRNGLEIRGRLTFEGLYPPRAIKDSGLKPTTGTGNIFGVPEDDREKFVRDNNLPIYDAKEHEVLFVLGCQGGNSPEVQPVVLATGKLLDGAGVKWGVLAKEKCWGEALLHGGGLMEDWPFWAQERIEALTEALGGDRSRTILTICPHCRDTIQTQYGSLGAQFTDVRMHVVYLSQLVAEGRLKIEPKPMEAAIHTPCKVVHNAESGEMLALLQGAGVKLREPETAGFETACCGGGGSGFLWDSPAKVNQKRWAQVQATGLTDVVTGCPGCHRMLGVVKDEEAKIHDVSTVLAERIKSS